MEDSQRNPIARYGYDPFDRRLWKDVYRSKDGALLTQAQRSYYLYAEEGLVAESQQAISHSNGQNVSTSTTPAIVNQYGSKPNNPYTTGVLFVKTKNSNNQSVYAYYHHDHLNTPIQATDKHGKVVWAGRYSAFGQVTDITPTATGDNPVIESSLRFPGQIEDAETGLYYNWRRYYDPEIGRYVTQDPIGLAGGMNLYAYVGGNPVNRIDPTGEYWSLVMGGIDLAFQLYKYNGNLKCIDWVDVGLGMLGGQLFMKAFKRLPGTEWSHWIPDRYIRPMSHSGKNPNQYYKEWVDKYFGWFVRSRFNGNYVKPTFHEKTDNFRNFTKGMKRDDKWLFPIQQFFRIPGWIPGLPITGAAFTQEEKKSCECN